MKKQKKSQEKYEYKSELQLMQEAYDGCCGRPGCKHQMDAFRKHPLPYEPDEDAEWEDEDYNDDGMDDAFDSNMEGFEEEPSEIDPSDMAEMVSDIKSYIADKLAEFGYDASKLQEVVVELTNDDSEIDLYGKDSSDQYDEENPYYDEDEEAPEDESEDIPENIQLGEDEEDIFKK